MTKMQTKQGPANFIFPYIYKVEVQKKRFLHTPREAFYWGGHIYETTSYPVNTTYLGLLHVF